MSAELYRYDNNGKVEEVTARQWDGSEEQAEEIVKWIRENDFKAVFFEKGSLDFDLHLELIDIETSNGDVGMQKYWWVILGQDKTFYIEPPTVFETQYKKVAPSSD